VVAEVCRKWGAPHFRQYGERSKMGRGGAGKTKRREKRRNKLKKTHHFMYNYQMAEKSNINEKG